MPQNETIRDAILDAAQTRARTAGYSGFSFRDIATDVGIKAAANVNVETSHGVVQLSGFAASDDQASRAVQAAKKVAGVRSVRNDIRVKSGT